MKRLDYSYNWNNKLQCKMHTTIRLSGRLNVGDTVAEFLNGQFQGHVKVRDKRRTLLNQINDWVAGIDTGYDRAETVRILQRMYKAKDVNWESQPIYIYLLERIDVQDAPTYSPQTAMQLI